MIGEFGSLPTERLILRRWRDADRPLLAAIHADPLVMATLGPPMSRAQSDTTIERIEQGFAERGYGWWCVEVVGGPVCIGWVGLGHPEFEASFTPCTEIGWRIASGEWGKGYAVEAARTVLQHAFGRLGLDEVVAFTAAINTKSRRVMEKLDMVHDLFADFDHPRLEPGDPLRPHALYRIARHDLGPEMPAERAELAPE